VVRNFDKVFSIFNILGIFLENIETFKSISPQVIIEKAKNKK